MAEVNPPIFIQSGSHPAEDWRRAMSAMFGHRAGIVQSGDLAVTQQSTPNMSVQVATGMLVLTGTENTYQGVYVCENRGAETVTIAAADPTNGRRDLIVARIRDAAYSGATNSFSIEAVTGTPAASPVDPTIPANSYVLARIAVNAGATSITNANITDGRAVWFGQYGRAAGLGGIIACTDTTQPPHQSGRAIYESNTKRLSISDGTNWHPPGALGELARTTRTSNSVTFSTIVYPNSVAADLLPNRRIRVRVHVNLSSTVAGTNVSIGVANNVGTILNQAYCTLATANAGQQMTVEYETTSGAGGSTTFQISAFTAANTAIIVASGTSATYLTVYDEGPA